MSKGLFAFATICFTPGSKQDSFENLALLFPKVSFNKLLENELYVDDFVTLKTVVHNNEIVFLSLSMNSYSKDSGLCNEADKSFLNCLLVIFATCHFVLFENAGNKFDLEYLRMLNVISAAKKSLLPHATAIFSELSIDGLTGLPAQCKRAKKLRVLPHVSFLFDTIHTEDPNINQEDIIKSFFEMNGLVCIHDRKIKDSDREALFSLASPSFVFSKSIAADYKCEINELSWFSETSLLSKNSDNSEEITRWVLPQIKNFPSQTASFCFRELKNEKLRGIFSSCLDFSSVIVSSLLPSFTDWFNITKFLCDVICKSKNCDFISESISSSIEISLSPDKLFSNALCSHLSKMSVNAYSESSISLPLLYSKDDHKKILDKIHNFYILSAVGDSKDFYWRQTVDELDNVFRNEKELCGCVSYDGVVCSLKSHATLNKLVMESEGLFCYTSLHFTSTQFIRSCFCGLSQIKYDYLWPDYGDKFPLFLTCCENCIFTAMKDCIVDNFVSKWLTFVYPIEKLFFDMDSKCILVDLPVKPSKFFEWKGLKKKSSNVKSAYFGFEYVCLVGHRFFSESLKLDLTQVSFPPENIPLNHFCKCSLHSSLNRILVFSESKDLVFFPILCSTGKKILHVDCPSSIKIPTKKLCVISIPFILQIDCIKIADQEIYLSANCFHSVDYFNHEHVSSVVESEKHDVICESINKSFVSVLSGSGKIKSSESVLDNKIRLSSIDINTVKSFADTVPFGNNVKKKKKSNALISK